LPLAVATGSLGMATIGPADATPEMASVRLVASIKPVLNSMPALPVEACDPLPRRDYEFMNYPVQSFY
jgi:hypothetical protein